MEFFLYIIWLEISLPLMGRDSYSSIKAAMTPQTDSNKLDRKNRRCLKSNKNHRVLGHVDPHW